MYDAKLRLIWKFILNGLCNLWPIGVKSVSVFQMFFRCTLDLFKYEMSKLTFREIDWGVGQTDGWWFLGIVIKPDDWDISGNLIGPSVIFLSPAGMSSHDCLLLPVTTPYRVHTHSLSLSLSLSLTQFLYLTVARILVLSLVYYLSLTLSSSFSRTFLRR